MGNLTLRQYRYWVQQQLSPRRPVQRVLTVVPISPTTAQSLPDAWDHVARYVDSVRAVLRETDGVPRIEFTDTYRPLDYFELGPTEDVPAAIADLVASEWALFPSGSFLIKQGIVRTATGELYRISTGSHLVCDGISHDLLSQHLNHTLADLSQGKTPSPIDAPSFEASMAEEVALEAAQQPTGQTPTPAEYAPIPFFGLTANREDLRKQRAAFDLTRKQTQLLIEAAQDPDYFFKSTEVTLANLFTALIAAWTWHHSHVTEFSIGVPFHGRNNEERALIGFKSENLVLSLKVDPSAPFSALVRQVHQRAQEALRHRGYSVANAMHAPAYQVASNFKFQRVQLSSEEPTQAGLELPHIAGDPESVYFMQTPSPADASAFRLVLGLKTALLTHTSIDYALQGLVQALSVVSQDTKAPIDTLPFIDTEWRRTVDIFAHPELSARFNGLFTRWQAGVDQDPENAALVQGDEALTHRALRQRVGQVAYALVHHHQISPGDRVMVQAENSIELVVVYLACLAAGAVYVPLSNTAPSAVRQAVVEQTQPTLVVTEQSQETHCTTLSLRQLARASGPTFTLADQSGSQIAHIFHTSGTTGAPKAIAVTHGALGASLRAFFARVELASGERIYATYAPTFDPWITAVFGALWYGGTFYLPQAAPLTSKTLQAFVARNGITTLCTPTAYFHAQNHDTYAGLRRWVVGGETLSATHATRFLQANSGTRLHNAYGPTETTIWATVADVHSGSVPPSVGAPLPSVGVRVVSPTGGPTPRGVPGELLLAGPQLAAGYYEQPGTTAESFVHAEGTRWYRTGDLVRQQPNNQIDFLGRIDRQIKVRGHRVEPSEVEDALTQLDGVADAWVAPVIRANQQKLVGYLVTDDAKLPATVVELKAKLLKVLPDYKVPTWLIALAELPRQLNGKIDHAALPEPQSDNREDADRLPSLTAWDVRFLFEEVLGIDRVRVDDDFFALGGDSLSLVKLLNAIDQHFGRQLDASDVLANPTVGGLAPLLEQEREREARLQLQLRSGTRPPLFCIPGAGGIGVEFYPLSRHAPSDQPIVVLRSRGTDGHQHPPKHLDALIDEHVRHILAYPTDAACYLIGYSIGGAFACELARRLEELNRTVQRVFILDSVHPDAARDQRNAQASLKQRGVRAINYRKQIEAFSQQLDRDLGASRIMAAADLGEYNRLAQYHLYLQLDLKPIRTPITYFKAKASDMTIDTELWRSLSERFDIVEVAGEHTGEHAMVREPYARDLAAKLFPLLTQR